MTVSSHATAFPTLTEDELNCLAQLGQRRRFSAGEVLFQNGERGYSFFAITSGEVRITESSRGRPQEVITHQPGEFTGDVTMLSGRPPVVTATAVGDCEVIEIPSCTVRRMLAEVPDLSDKLLKAFQVRRELLEASDFLGVRIVGAADSKDTLQLREFFYKNKVPFTFYDVAEEEGQQTLAELAVSAEETPVIACSEHIVRKPSLAKVAECLGISREIDNDLYDVLIVGAGPAGLAAGVYGASEGLKTLIVDAVGPGGQAGQSSKIENYIGFPAGLPGAELANLGFLQAMKFGASFTAPIRVHSMQCTSEGNHRVELCTGQTVHTKTVLIATGASYRRLPVENCSRLEGAGVYYSATSVEARMCRNSTAVVVGGGNSAGQAAMFLSQHACEVKMLLRGNDLRKSMSDYLARRIEQNEKIEVLCETEVQDLTGDIRLRQLTICNNTTRESVPVDCAGLFIFVGAKPHTEWLPNEVALDERGFVLTGPAIRGCNLWTEDREPCELETTCPGVFAAGDVRSGTTKRCAFAAGDGALAITCVHQYLNRG